MIWLNTLELVKDYFIIYFGIISFYKVLKLCFPWFVNILVYVISCSCTASGCDKKFNTQSNLKKHFERKHKNQQKQYRVSMNAFICFNCLNIFSLILKFSSKF